MTEYIGYCMHCKKRQKMKDVVIKKTKNARIAKGTCVVCGGKMAVTIGKED